MGVGIVFYGGGYAVATMAWDTGAGGGLGLAERVKQHAIHLQIFLSQQPETGRRPPTAPLCAQGPL